ncbi:DUF3237 domain-containing protein [Sorangium sp. So ce118]
MSIDEQLIDHAIEHLFSYTIGIAELESIGLCPEGLRTNAYCMGGVVSGPRVRGKLRPVGGNWPVLRRDGVALIDYRLTLEADDGALIYLTCMGVSDFGEDAYQKIERGEAGQLARYRDHRAAVQCHTAHPDYLWLNRVHCLGIGRFDSQEMTVRYDVYAVR